MQLETQNYQLLELWKYSKENNEFLKELLDKLDSGNGNYEGDKKEPDQLVCPGLLHEMDNNISGISKQLSFSRDLLRRLQSYIMCTQPSDACMPELSNEKGYIETQPKLTKY